MRASSDACPFSIVGAGYLVERSNGATEVSRNIRKVNDQCQTPRICPHIHGVPSFWDGDPVGMCVKSFSIDKRT